ncbi:MAG: hypothetical protein AVDCRST_MAG11-2908, partial [uncultured Gemmatimonadaceae bacterium]
DGGGSRERGRGRGARVPPPRRRQPARRRAAAGWGDGRGPVRGLHRVRAGEHARRGRRPEPVAAAPPAERERRVRHAAVRRAALAAGDAVRAHRRVAVPPGRAPQPVPPRRLPEAGRGAAAIHRAPRRPDQGDRRVLGRRPELGAAARPLVPARRVGGAARRPDARRDGQDVLRAEQRDLRREHRGLGREARVRLGAPGDRGALLEGRQDGALVGRAGARRGHDARRAVAPVPARDLPHAPLPGVHLRAQRVLGRRRRDPRAVHRERRVRRGRGGPRWVVTRGAGARPRPPRHALVADLLRRRRRGGPLAPLRRDPLRGGRRAVARDRPQGRRAGVGEGGDVLRGDGRAV